MGVDVPTFGELPGDLRPDRSHDLRVRDDKTARGEATSQSAAQNRTCLLVIVNRADRIARGPHGDGSPRCCPYRQPSRSDQNPISMQRSVSAKTMGSKNSSAAQTSS